MLPQWQVHQRVQWRGGEDANLRRARCGEGARIMSQEGQAGRDS